MFADQLAALFKEIPAAQAGNSVRNEDFNRKSKAKFAMPLSVPDLRRQNMPRIRLSFFPCSDTRRAAQQPRGDPGASSKTNSEVALQLPAENASFQAGSGGRRRRVCAAPAIYKEWYSILLLDRLIHRIVPLRISSDLQLAAHPTTTVSRFLCLPGSSRADRRYSAAGTTATAVYVPKRTRWSRQKATRERISRAKRRWSGSPAVEFRRDERRNQVDQAMTADDLRVAARDLLLANRVLATWSPKPRQTAVEVEDLRKSDPAVKPPAASPPAILAGEALPPPAFPQHSDPSPNLGTPEKLASGVSTDHIDLVVTRALDAGATGVKLTGAEVLRTFQTYRPDRILVFAPRNRWIMSGGCGVLSEVTATETQVLPGKCLFGRFAGAGDLKTLVDRKVIQAGWWNDVEVKISASEGSMLTISGDADKRAHRGMDQAVGNAEANRRRSGVGA